MLDPIIWYYTNTIFLFVAGILHPSPLLQEGLGVRAINYLCHLLLKNGIKLPLTDIADRVEIDSEKVGLV